MLPSPRGRIVGFSCYVGSSLKRFKRGRAWLMVCVGSPLPVIAVGSILAWSVNWLYTPSKPDWSRAPAFAHESCSCDEELRQLLRAHSDLEWFRLFLILAATVLACLVIAAAGIATAVLGCCWPCAYLACLRPRARDSYPVRARSPLARDHKQADLLAILAAGEIRR